MHLKQSKEKEDWSSTKDKWRQQQRRWTGIEHYTIDVKGVREKENKHDDRGSMMIGGEHMLPSMTKGKIVEQGCHWCQRESKSITGPAKTQAGSSEGQANPRYEQLQRMQVRPKVVIWKHINKQWDSLFWHIEEVMEVNLVSDVSAVLGDW